MIPKSGPVSDEIILQQKNRAAILIIGMVGL